MLPAINVVKLTIILYIRSWAVCTCNVPMARVFRASRSNNFYLVLLMIMLFVAIVPIFYVIFHLTPSSCGPFGGSEKIYYVVGDFYNNDIDKRVRKILDHIISPSFMMPAVCIMILVIYYLQVRVTN